MFKTCSYCSLEKPLEDFYRKCDSKDGLTTRCKACVAVQNKQQYAKFADKRKQTQREYYVAHREQCRASARKYHAEHAEEMAEGRRRWQRTAGWATTLVCRARGVAKCKGYDFDLDAEFVRSLYEKQDGRCHWLNVPFECVDEHRNPLQPSLDRIDCNRGYTRDNVVLASQFANMGRSDMSADRFRVFIEQLSQSLKNSS